MDHIPLEQERKTSRRVAFRAWNDLKISTSEGVAAERESSQILRMK
jgi:hypothetical protein